MVVVRHGERLDYVLRDQGQNWVAENWGNRPWDPPLTTNGLEQAKALGQHLPTQLTKLQLPPLSRVYSSPFLRCRQTALGIAQTSPLMSNVSTDSNSVNQDLPEKIRVELGLAESINENWFRSWAIPGADGTWGYMKKQRPTVDHTTVHPASKQPVHPLLDWKATLSDPTLSWVNERTDKHYLSKSSIDIPFQFFPPRFESFNMQRKRMEQTLNLLSEHHVDETFVIVSHGKLMLNFMCFFLKVHIRSSVATELIPDRFIKLLNTRRSSNAFI